MSFWTLLFGGKAPPKLEPLPQPVTCAEVAKGRGFTFDLSGESHFQDELDSVCGGKCEDGYKLECLAQLFFINDNEFDPNAVGVMIDGNPVGYVPGHLTEAFRKEILAVNPDLHPMLCSAKIVGGWDRGDGDEGHYGVKLSLSRPLRVKFVERTA